MRELCFGDLSVAEAAASGDELARFARRLPEACLEAGVGLDPARARLLVHVIPERPEGHAFSAPIFMGSGAHSARECGLLLGRVTEALSLLSANQQAGLASLVPPRSQGPNERQIEAIVRDMAMALTGKRIEFV